MIPIYPRIATRNPAVGLDRLHHFVSKVLYFAITEQRLFSPRQIEQAFNQLRPQGVRAKHVVDLQARDRPELRREPVLVPHLA